MYFGYVVLLCTKVAIESRFARFKEMQIVRSYVTIQLEYRTNV
jgi:hypothetical protein